MRTYDVVVLGGGPAGLAAALSAHRQGGNTLIIERENRLGGILKQCIHDGFGLVKFKERLSGPEYGERYIKMILEEKIATMLSTFVTKVEREEDKFLLTLVTEKGIRQINTKTLILANGCRERTARQVFIHGSKPAGVLTAGTAQYFVNILGYMPFKKCAILGSGDIGLIMARRLTLEGAKVLGVYEAKSTASGLTRNIAQCLNDYDIPLHLSHTITRVIGKDRVEGIEISKTDESMKPIKGTEKIIECDGVVLSVGLIPENEIAEGLGVKIDKLTKGPYVDQSFMTLEEGIFSCGNALHVNDLVDYVSESGEYAGQNAVRYAKEQIDRDLIPIGKSTDDFMYVVPQYINYRALDKKIIIYFRAKEEKQNTRVQIHCDENIVFDKRYRFLKPPEMERIELDLSGYELKTNTNLSIEMVEG